MPHSDLAIVNAIAKLQDLVLQFQRCLAQEAEALAAWPPQGLWPIQEEKVRLVRDLETAHAVLREHISQQGQDLSAPETLSPEVLPYWQTLRQDLAQCHQLNASHERCLARQQLAIKQSLELLLVKLDQDVTYGRQGHCQGSRRLGSIGHA